MPTTLNTELTALKQKLGRDLGYIEAAIARLEQERAQMQSKLTGVGLVLGHTEPSPQEVTIAPPGPELPAERTRVPYQGRLQSWNQIAQIAGVRVGGNSAHRVLFKRHRDLHDSIPHQCSYTEHAAEAAVSAA